MCTTMAVVTLVRLVYNFITGPIMNEHAWSGQKRGKQNFQTIQMGLWRGVAIQDMTY